MKPCSLLLLLPLTALAADFRPPAVPLITHDPYFSIWSMADHLTDRPTKHWTGAVQSLTSLVRIDGNVYRIMGTQPQGTPALPQTHVQVLPTHTIYQFDGAGIRVDLTFLTPSLPDDLDILSRPATYLTWRVRSLDNAPHDVSIYFDAGTEIAVNTREEPVDSSTVKMGDFDALRAGTRQQPVLARSGDDLRIDWGYLYVAAPPGADASLAATLRSDAVKTFGGPTGSDSHESVLACTFALGPVRAEPVSRHLVIAYDDEYSIEYLNQRLRPYWRRNGDGAPEMLRAAFHDYDALERRATRFDETLMADLRKAGGDDYALLCALAYRQTLAAHKLVAGPDGTPLYFSKENFSNGSIDTVDVTYPSSPFFLLFNTHLLEGQLKPILDYASLPRWPFPFAPHDLGRYPLANGQQYGGGEKTEENQMPVEESGNMLLMVAAMEQVNGNVRFAERYWPVLTKWAEYLRSKGLDPENQLCTDDFAGHLAHNANLSAKAILALAAYGKLAGLLHHGDVQQKYEKLARDYAGQWVEMSKDQDHSRLAFDRPDTWSQKYNLVWDKLLWLRLFPNEVVDRELAFYLKHMNIYGLPLDNRAKYTKIDWLTWTASLSTTRDEFEKIFDGAYRFANETPSRVPLSDWYETGSARQDAFQARSVVGGVFIQMLNDQTIWKKYSSGAE